MLGMSGEEPAQLLVLNPLSLQKPLPSLHPPIACSASRIDAEALTSDLQTLLRPTDISIDLICMLEPPKSLFRPMQDSGRGCPCSCLAHAAQARLATGMAVGCPVTFECSPFSAYCSASLLVCGSLQRYTLGNRPGELFPGVGL